MLNKLRAINVLETPANYNIQANVLQCHDPNPTDPETCICCRGPLISRGSPSVCCSNKVCHQTRSISEDVDQIVHLSSSITLTSSENSYDSTNITCG